MPRIEKMEVINIDCFNQLYELIHNDNRELVLAHKRFVDLLKTDPDCSDPEFTAAMYLSFVWLKETEVEKNRLRNTAFELLHKIASIAGMEQITKFPKIKRELWLRSLKLVALFSLIPLYLFLIFGTERGFHLGLIISFGLNAWVFGYTIFKKSNRYPKLIKFLRWGSLISMIGIILFGLFVKK